jgi:hypothetical protein
MVDTACAVGRQLQQERSGASVVVEVLERSCLPLPPRAYEP